MAWLLGEAGCAPDVDLAAAASSTHVIIAPARLDDPVRGEVAEALGRIVRRDSDAPVIVAHTGADLLPEPGDRERMRQRSQGTFERGPGRPLPFVELSLAAGELGGTPPPGSVAGLRPLLRDVMPEVAVLLARESCMEGEPARWAEHRAVVLWHARIAGAADAVPLAGGAAATAIQARMLQVLAGRCGVERTRARLIEFGTARGAGIAVRLVASPGLRPLIRLVPVWGQTAGAAASRALSLAATYALGRAAAFHLHRSVPHEAVSPAEVRAVSEAALRQGRP